MSSSMCPGSIINVVQAFKTDTAAYGTGLWTNISGLTLSITPSSVNSKILLMFHVEATLYQLTMQLRFARNNNGIGIGDNSGYKVLSTVGSLYASSDQNHQQVPHSAMFLDTPATTQAINYSVQIRTQDSITCYINRSRNDVDENNWSHRSTSSLTALEIVG